MRETGRAIGAEGIDPGKGAAPPPGVAGGTNKGRSEPPFFLRQLFARLEAVVDAQQHLASGETKRTEHEHD